MSRVSTPAQTSDSTSRPVRSPFVGINEVFNNWIPGHEKGLRTGFYNSISLIFLLFVLIVIYYCYWILRPFLQPLVWAILCGSALHPFKRRLLLYSAKWISDVKTNGRPISVATLLLPLMMIKFFAQLIETFWFKYYKLILAFVVPLVISHFFSNYCLTLWNQFCSSAYSPFMIIIHYFVILSSHLTNSDNTFLIITLTIGYLIALSFGWSDSTKEFLTYISPLIWISLLVNIMSLCGTFGQLMAIVLVIIVIIGLIQSMIGASDQTDGFGSISQKIKDVLKLIGHYVMKLLNKEKEQVIDTSCDTEPESSEDILETSVTDSKSMSEKDILENISKIRRTSLISNREEKTNASNRYLYAVLWAVVIVQICSHQNFIFFALIPIVFQKILTIVSTNLSNIVFNNIHRFNEFVEKRNKALFHPFLRKLFNFFLIGDRVISTTIESSLNGLISLSVISITIISFLFIGIFISIQIYGESIHLINSISNVLNQTINSYPESGQLLPQGFRGMNGMLDQMVKNGYEYGREYIQHFVQNTLNVDQIDNKTTAVEKQVLEIWDRAYHLWLIRNSSDNDNYTLPKKGPYEYDKLYNALSTLNVELCFNIVKENIDTLLSVLDSVWLVLKGNITLLLSAVAAVFSILLGGGLGLMNLGLNFIIFTTALFYLLSASGEYYKPVELVNRLFPSESSQPTNRSFDSETKNKFGRAVEEAVNGVFAASLKMSAFYGLYTYLIHVLFAVNIVYIPSVMAATLGAVPFLSPFWASFPASLELFFAHSERTKAILLLISAYFPSLFVDSTIYSEIKSGGHPYLTGLAIAGGVFYLGFEGAIFGPMLLCFLFVAFNMYTSIMDESPVKPDLKSQFRRMQSLL